MPAALEHSPHGWQCPVYGTAQQMAPAPDATTPLPAAGITRLQQIIGTLLYYARAVDPTLLVALGLLAAAQANGMEATATAAVQLLNYCATHPDACIRYKASGMTLYIHLDASYLSEPQACSRAGGHFFLSQVPTDPKQPPSRQPMPNGPLHTTSLILRNVMALEAEAELGALFNNAQQATIL